MEDSAVIKANIIGRETELGILKNALENTKKGQGATLFISGEAGIGKTWLLDEFISHTRQQNLKILSGAAAADTLEPFLIYKKLLHQEMDISLFHQQEYTSFAGIFAVNRAGILLAQATALEEELDADIFAGMLSAVQDFVKDSFDQDGTKHAGLGRLEYGDMKIMIEHSEHLYLTAVFKGAEHQDMINILKRTIKIIENEQGQFLENWSGEMAQIRPIQDIITSLATSRFLVKRRLEGIMLDNERVRIADNVLDILLKLEHDNPLIVILEDLQWVDESSLFVLNYLARNIRSENILILGSFRPGESQTLTDTLERMKEEDLVKMMELKMFHAGEVSSLLEKLYPGGDFPEEFLDNLTSQCRGNPFFTTELLRQMGDDGSIGMKNGKYVLLSSDYTIPSSVEDIVYNRLDKLESEAMMLVEYLSCIGQKFDDDAISSFKIIANSNAAMEHLNDSGIIISSGGSNEFSHAIFQNIIYKCIGARWKTIFHKGLGEFYEEKYANRHDEVLYEMARHFSASTEHQKAFGYCIRAGEKAASTFAPEQGIIFYEKALEILPKLKLGPDSLDKKIELREWLGDMHTIVGNYKLAFERYDISDFKECQNSTKARLLRKTGYVHEKTGNYDGAIESSKQARALLEPDNHQELGRILIGEGSAYWRKGEYESAMKCFTDAYDTFSKVGGADQDCADALRMVGNIFISQGKNEEALEYTEKSLLLMEKSLNLSGMASALNNIGIIYRRMGDLDLALEYQTRGLEMRKKMMEKRGIAFSLINIGNLNWDRGDLGMALENYESSLEIMDVIGDRHGSGLSLSNIGLVHMNRGDMELALQFQSRGLDIRQKIKDKHGVAESIYNIALLHLNMDSPELAVEHFQKCLDTYTGLGDKPHSIQSKCGLAEASMRLGKLDRAMEQAEEALEMSINSSLQREEGMSHRILGMIHREQNNLESSAREFESAMAILEEVGEKTELAYLLYEHAILLKEMGDHDGARKNLETARTMFQAMGMKRWEEKTQIILGIPT